MRQASGTKQNRFRSSYMPGHRLHTLYGLFALVSALWLTACTDIPRDPNGTTERILNAQSFRAGIVSGSASDPTNTIVKRIESQTRAKAILKRGEATLLLKQLEDGQIDLVVGSFAENSPLKTSVTFSAPLGNRMVTAEAPVIRAATPLGENRWSILVEKAVRQP